MSFTHIRTNTDAMDAHGKHLTGEITAGLDKAEEAAASVDLGPDVMGILGYPWTLIFIDELNAARELLEKLPGAMESTGTKVKDAAQEFRDRDEDAADSLGMLI